MTIFTPKNEAELSEIIRGATSRLSVVGGGTRRADAIAGDVLSISGLEGVDRYEPGALTLVVQAGTPVAEVEALLASERQRLAFEPMDHRGLLGTIGEPTMGGIYAANVSGPRRIQVGAARDFALGVRFLNGSGEIVENGGRVMKNVTGYDLVKLLAGSAGALGVITQMGFKTLPMAETSGHVAVEVADPVQAVAAMSRALGSPYDVTGAAWVGSTVLIRVEGFEASVKYRLNALKDVLGGFGDVDFVSGPASAQAWTDVRDVAPFHGQAGDVWCMSVKPTDGPLVVAALGADCYMDWGGGRVWARVPVGTDVLAQLSGIAGIAERVRGGALQRSRPDAVTALEQSIKNKFDPRGVLPQVRGL